jgi:hypothetical protein
MSDGRPVGRDLANPFGGRVGAGSLVIAINPVRDPEIRAELHRSLRNRHRSGPSRIVDENTLLGGASRIDVAAINGRLEGYEIKSEADSLVRLMSQASAYARVFDRLTLICAERHLGDALDKLPPWWGIEVAHEHHGRPRLQRKRTPKANRSVDPEALVSLLWRPEMLSALEARGVARGLRSAPRRVLRVALLEAMGAQDLRRLVRDSLCARKGWLAGG